MLDLNQESSKTAGLFLVNLILMVLSLFVLVGVMAITLIVSYASDEIDELGEKPNVDTSIFKHNFF